MTISIHKFTKDLDCVKSIDLGLGNSGAWLFYVGFWWHEWPSKPQKARLIRSPDYTGNEVMANVRDNNALQKINKIVDDKMHDAIFELKGEASINTPVKSGALLASLGDSYDGSSKIGTVGYTAPYSHYLEFGTIKMSARRFLQKSIDNASSKLKDIFKKWI